MAKKLEEAQRRVLDAQSKLNAARTSRDTAAAKALDNQKQQQQELQKVELQGDDKAEKARQKELDDAEKLAERRRRDAEEFARQEGQRITASAEFRNERERLSYELAKELAESNLDHQKAMIDAKFDYELAGMDGLHAKHKRNAKELLEIELRGIKRVADAETAMTNAALKVKAAQAMRQAKQQAAQLLPQEQAVGGGSSGGRMQGYLRRLSFLETGIRNVPNAQGSGAMGFFQTKGPFHGEALTASGGMNSRSGNYSEAAGAVEAWIKKHRPKAYDAILAGNFDAADAILSQGTWPSLPGGSQARPPEVQRQARQFLAPPAAPSLPRPAVAPRFSRGQMFQGFPITSIPGESRAYRGGTHEGYDVATPIGTALSYAIGGIVKRIDKVGKGNIGKMVEVQLENGVIGFSGHLSEVLVEVGQRFTANQIIAKTGDTGAGGAHLHQESAPFGYKQGAAGESMAFLQLGGQRQAVRPVSGARNTIVNAAQEAEYSVETAQIERTNEAMRQLQKSINGTALDLGELKARLREDLAEAFPVEQLRLEQSLLKQRNQLLLEGAPEEYIQAREQITRSEQDAALMAAQYESKIRELSEREAAYQELVKEGGTNQAVYKVELQGVQDRLAAYREQLEKLTPEQARYNAEVLTAAVNALKNADALKAVEEATAMVNSAVEGVVSSYKDLFVDIMSGGDIKEAAKKMQESLSKQVFTMFIDFSMKPVEKFFKDQLLSIFGLPNEESKRAEVIAQMERQIAALDRNTAALQSPGTGTGAAAPSSLIPAGAGFGNLEAVGKAGELAQGATEKLFELPAAMSSLTQASESITANFAQATGSLVQQSQAGAVAASAWQQNLGKTVSAVGIAASSIMGITAGVSQIKEGGISGVLGGIGSIAMSMGSLLGGFGGLGIFGGGGATGGSGMPWNFNSPIKLFANGGVVNGPTLGMVGEGRYSEAIVPLPDGRSIPVKMSDQSASLRDAMNTMSPLTAMAPILSMKFETTNIGGVEYVSRDQLEAAMATTRRQAAKDGAMRGMNMTLDKIQQSPATRGRLGMRRG
jgi:murein DD-endopeptidase MepM/ murein hydrolase activator NlpD